MMMETAVDAVSSILVRLGFIHPWTTLDPQGRAVGLVIKQLAVKFLSFHDE